MQSWSGISCLYFQALFIGCFVENFGVTYAFQDELTRVMNPIEIAHIKGWLNLWVETDSMLVTLAYKSSAIVPWRFRNRWNDCIVLLRDMNFVISRIYRDSNGVVDRLVAIGLSSSRFVWFNAILNFGLVLYNQNRLGMSAFRGLISLLAPYLFKSCDFGPLTN